MFIQASSSIDADREDGVSGRPAHPDDPPATKLRQIYLGVREAGHPVMLVVRDGGTERLADPPSGEFDWGWPSMGGTRRLARALLLDLTGREPPQAVQDALVTEELAHLPWTSFSLTGQELVGWLHSYGYEFADWPAANSASETPHTKPISRSLIGARRWPWARGRRRAPLASQRVASAVR